jgi:hypothetical protein
MKEVGELQYLCMIAMLVVSIAAWQLHDSYYNEKKKDKGKL